MKLKEKVAVITGAAQGLGAHFAVGLAEEGANVLVADILDGGEVVQRINENGGRAAAMICDVSDEKDCNKMIETAESLFGGVDILVSNAAIFSELKLQSMMDIPVEEWDRTMAVNIRGVWFSAKAAIPAMQKRGGGSIINIATNRALIGVPMMLHYDASKGAVLAMTRAMAAELGDKNIRVNAVAPGLTMSEQVLKREGIAERNSSIVNKRPLKRTQTPEDLIGSVVFLASDASEFITGQTIIVDGGSVMR